MKRRTALICLVAALAGCGDTTGYTGQLGGGKGAPVIVVQNRTSATIAMVFISPCTVTTWGANWLGSAETIAPTADRPFTVTVDCWDIRAETADQRFVERAGIELGAGDRFSFTVTGF